PAVRATPALKKLMKQARASVDTSSSESGGGDSGPERTLEEFTHEPISSARAGESMPVEARVPKDMSVESVVFYFQRYNQDTWTEIQLEATEGTRFATEVPGDKIYTSQIAYYLEAVDASGNTLATSGDRRNPHTVTVLGASSYDPEAGDTTAQNGDTDEEEPTTDPTSPEPSDDDGDDGNGGDDESSSDGSRQLVYFEIGGGTGGGFLTKYSDTTRPPPTANPGRELGAGFAPAFGHATLGMGGVLSETMTLGLYFRWQFSPSQNFDEIRSRSPLEDDRRLYSGFKNGECLGTGLPGDCLLGAKYRWFFSNGPKLQAFSTVGAGIGRIRHWVRLKEASQSDFCQNNDKTIHRPAGQQNFCYRSDTARPGWMHFGLGAGITYEINEVFALIGEAYVT
ncbi:MAG: hypothetical protein ABEN55_22395, partial [Bradymonadaceae bacterium]